MMTRKTTHQSVLTEEILKLISPKSGGTYLDATFGGGGHSIAILEASAPEGRVIAVDRDPETAIHAEAVVERFGSRFQFEVMPYSQVVELDTQFDGVIADLGLSTDQLAESGRGFSYSRNEPLDMRFDSRGGQTAAQFLNQSSVTEIERIFREFGEDRHAGVLARKIQSWRRDKPVRTTFDFIQIVGTSNPSVLARLFQALRITVNDELTQVKKGLQALKEVLKPNGVLAVISFHSLEDRIVKEFMRQELDVLTRKPIVPGVEETERNPSARSAKLRAGRRPEG